jgi:hypothetical protein
MDIDGIQYLLETMDTPFTDEERALLAENFIVIPVGEAIPLDKKEGREFFEQTLKAIKPDMLLIDAYSDVSFASLSNDDGVRELTTYLHRVRKQHGVSIVLVHHDKKAQTADQKNVTDTFDKLYGSRFLSAKTDFVVSLKYSKERALVMTEEKKRFGREGPQLVLGRTDELDFEIIGEVESGQSGMDSTADEFGGFSPID